MRSGRYTKWGVTSILMGMVVAAATTTTSPGQTPAPTTQPKTSAKTKVTATKPALPLDLNKATEAELSATLPGVGEVTAKKIVAGRPYKSVDDLAKAGVPARTIEEIRKLVSVGPAATSPAPAVSAPAPTTGTAKAKAATTPTSKAAALDLNKADEHELESVLPGVGEATAKKIVAGRPYKSVDDLAKAGVPARTIEGIRNLVTVGAPGSPVATTTTATGTKTNAAPPVSPSTTKKRAVSKAKSQLAPGQKVNLNTASKEELLLLPNIGEVRAQSIIDARPFKTPEDVMKVKGIKGVRFSEIKDLITVN